VVMAQGEHGESLQSLTPLLPGRADDLAFDVRGDHAVVAWRQIGTGSYHVYWSEQKRKEPWLLPDGSRGKLSFGHGGYDPSVAVGADGEIVIAWNQERHE